jgi:MYXO-CTERM domain-containing protein
MAKNAISGKPWILKNGASTGPWTDPSHINDPNPRTAIGFTAGGAKVIMLVVDGRKAGAGGMVGNDLVTVMKEFGATEAMNLDGGGSTALFVDTGVVNDPSDGVERAVANAVMVLPATPPLPPDAGPDAAVTTTTEPTGETTETGGSPGTEGPAADSPATDEGGCHAAPSHAGDAWLGLLALVFLVARRRR